MEQDSRNFLHIPDVEVDCDLRRSAELLFGRLGAAMAGLLATVPGLTPNCTAADVQRSLGVSRTLAWQVYKIAFATDPLAIARHLPGTRAMSRVLQVAEQKGVTASVIDNVSGLLREIDRMIVQHADSRSAFVSLISSMADDDTSHVDRLHKRAYFRAVTHFSGAEAISQFKCTILHRSLEDPRQISGTIVGGLLGLQQRWMTAAWPLFRIAKAGAASPSGDMVLIGGCKPLSGDANAIESFVLKQFSSTPLPDLSFDEVPAGLVCKVQCSEIGRQGTTNCVFGYRIPVAWPVPTREASDGLAPSLEVNVPCCVAVHYVLVETGIMLGEPLLDLRDGIRNRDDAPISDGRLRTSDVVEYLGSEFTALRSTDVPACDTMIRQAISISGCSNATFQIYRCRIDFPIVPMSMLLKFDVNRTVMLTR